MISGAVFFLGILLLVILWVAVSYRVFLSQEPDLASDEDGFFPGQPGLPGEVFVETPEPSTVSHEYETESEPPRTSSASSESVVEANESESPRESSAPSEYAAEAAEDLELPNMAPKKSVPRNAMKVNKKAKRPRRKN